MADEPTTNPASGDKVASNPELQKLEQAVQSAGTEADTPSDQGNEEETPYGESFQQLAEKKGFKSVDDLVKAYQNAEGYNTRLSQELKQISQEIKSLKTPQREDEFDNLPQEQKQALELLGKVIDRKLSEKLQPIQQDLEVRKAQTEIERIKEVYPDVSQTDLETAIDFMEQNPKLTLEQAVKIATYDDVRVKQQARSQKAERVQQNKRAFVESGKTARSGDNVDYSKLTLEELESILPAHGEYVDSKGVLRRN